MISIYLVLFYTGINLSGVLAFKNPPTLSDIKVHKGLPSWVYTLETLKETGLTYTKDGKGTIEISLPLDIVDNKDNQNA